MDTSLSDLTMKMQQAEARRACWLHLGLTTNGSAFRDPEVLTRFLTGEKSISAYGKGLLTKAAVAAMDTSSGLATPSPLAAAILDLVDRAAVLPQLGAIKVPDAAVAGALETSDPVASFVAEGAPTPMSTLSFSAASLTAKKIAGSIAVSKELLKVGRPEATVLFERRLTAAVAVAWNTVLLDATAASAVRPAGLLNGLTAVTAGSDLQTTLGLVLAAVSGGAAAQLVVVTSAAIAARLMVLRDLAGLGIKVIIAPEAGAKIIALDPSGVAWVDAGGSVSLAENASVQMDTTPADPTSSATVLVDFFSRNLVGVRVTRFVGWTRRADAVAFATIT